MTKVAIYARVSTNKQELDAQIEACRNYCKQRGLDVVLVLSDIGSGKSFFNRPNFELLKTQLRQKVVDGVVVFRFDRLGRNMKEFIDFLEEMSQLGIEIYSVNESFDTTTAIGRAIRDFIVRLAQMEREMISEATKQRLASLKEAGIHVGRPKGAKDKRPRRKIGYWLRWERVRNRVKKG